MKKVLLTGATGFIGSHCIAPLLARDFEIHAVTSKPDASPVPSVTWHHANLLDLATPGTLVEKIQPTHLLHLAWYVVPGKVIASPLNFDWVVSSLELFRQFARIGGQRAVVSGSSYEYDWNYGYCSERLTPVVPNTAYGSCKRALHELLQSLATIQNVSLAWPRIFFLYGPNEHRERLVSSVILSLLKGQPALCSHGRQVRDYMHVQEVADALVMLLDSPVTGAINLSSGRATELREIVSSIGELMGRADLIRLGAIPARANDTPLVVGDNSRLVAELGWKQRIDFTAGLEQTITWWKNHPA